MIRDITVALIVIVLWLAWVHFHPYRECRWCRRRRRRRNCWRCKGIGQTRRWGAWHTHKLVLALREAWAEWRDR